MNRIVFLPRKVAAQWKPVSGSALVSLYDISEQPLTPQAGWAEVLYQRFHDTDGQQLGLEVFSSEQAREILAFAERHRDAPELVVHCQMGHSRSAAVALFLSELLSVTCFKEQTRVNALTWTGYNRKVYSTLFTAVHGPIGSAFAAA